MIGMSRVKDQMGDLVARAIVSRERADAGLPVEDRTMHLVFAGPPGTGKSTIADKVGELYHALGLIPSNKVITAKKTDLIGSVMGETQEKTQALFDKARGGVLFIDEAYALHGGDQDMYGQQAIDTLVDNMDRHRGDTVVIMAGYPKEMRTLISTNPGLASRVPTTVHFPAYTKGELGQIMSKFMADGGYKGAPGAKAVLSEAIAEVAGGNAREVRNLYERIVAAQERRVAPMKKPGQPIKAGQLRRITPEDVEHAVIATREARLADEPVPGPKPKRKARA
jgi:replication-associated recombination protein RarA